MNREILFRGKRKDNGEWAYGSYVHIEQYKSSADYIADEEPNQWVIVPETVGQYTGLTDKNGRMIFEGDILKISFWKDTLYAIVKFGDYNQPDKILRSHLGFYFDFVNSESVRKDVGYWTGRTFGEIEVIGNVHDNPELLKGEGEREVHNG